MVACLEDHREMGGGECVWSPQAVWVLRVAEQDLCEEKAETKSRISLVSL